MGFIERRTRFGEGTRPTIYFAILATVLTLPAVLLLAFPARALADADLSIIKQGPPRLEPGEKFDYVLRVSNAEEADTANNVEVKDELPLGVTYEDYEAPTGVTCTPPPASTVTCTVPTLAAEESKEITLTVRAPLNAGVIENRATASAAEDPESPVGSNTVTTTVAPILAIKKLDDPDPVNPEDVLLYFLRVENRGEGVAKGVAVTDELPLDKVDFISVDSQDFDCEHTAGVIQCNADHDLAPGEIVKATIAVEPEKAGTIQNTGAVFAQGVRDPLDTDTESTRVTGGGNGGGGNGGGGNGGGGNGGDDLPEGDQCSPVVREGTEIPVGVLSDTKPQGFLFTNVFNDVLPLRIVYATSSENGSLTLTAKSRAGGEQILDRTIQGKKSGVIEVDTDPGVKYEIMILPEDQGYAIKFEMGVGPEECTDPADLEPPAGPGGNDGTNGDSGDSGDTADTGDTGVNGADDVIDDTISDNSLPPTGGPSLPGLAVIALGLAVLGGATVVGAGVRRRDR